MYGIEETLIVVYKDELVKNQLRKLIESKDDEEDDKIVGTKDDSIKIVEWDEKQWLAQKKAGTIDSKILFVGKIKGVEKNLEPLIDVKFNRWGIKYGWSGKSQALLIVDESVVSKKEDYDDFLKEFKKRSLPEKEKTNVKVKTAKFVAITHFFKLAGLLSALAVDYFKDKAKVRQQLYLYGILELYYNHLEEFMEA